MPPIFVGQQTVPVEEATAAVHELVPAVTGRAIQVVGGMLVFGGINSISFQSGTTDITGVMDFGANSQLQLGLSSIRTADGEALNMTLTAAEKVSGWITYELI